MTKTKNEELKLPITAFDKILQNMTENKFIRVVMEPLKLPKAILVLFNQETNEIIAENGKWNRLPMDGEKLVAEYKNKHQTKYNG